MKEINKDVIKDCASRLMYEMTDDQICLAEEELKTTLEQVNLINQIKEVENYEPMTFPFDVTTDYLREDEPEITLSRDEALKNAQDVLEGQIRLPKVVG